MRKLLFITVFALMLIGCSRPDATKQVLAKQGYTQIQTHGYGLFSCDEKDTFSTKFTALSPAGVRVSGVVCSGVFKGHTIRFD